jgi:hypothetical protein
MTKNILINGSPEQNDIIIRCIQDNQTIVDTPEIFNIQMDPINPMKEIVVNMCLYYINRIGYKYLCTKGLDKNLEGVEFMYVCIGNSGSIIGESIDTYNRICDYLNECETIDPEVWAGFLPRNPKVPQEIINDFESIKRSKKIKTILKS